MAAPSPLVSQPPSLQQVAAGINEVVQPAARIPVVDEVTPVLAFTIDVNQVVRRVFWSMDSFLMTGANTILFWNFSTVPQSETRRYLHVWISEPRVSPAVTLSVVYPPQGVIAETVGGIIAASKSADLLDILSPGNLVEKTVYPGLPVDVFPQGHITGRTLTPLAAGDTVKIFSVWERLAPPNTAQAESDPIEFVEA